MKKKLFFVTNLVLSCMFLSITSLELKYLKDTYTILAPEYQHSSPVHGAIGWHTGLIKKYYIYGHEGDATTALIKNLFHLAQGSFNVTKNQTSTAYHITPTLIGEIVGSIATNQQQIGLPAKKTKKGTQTPFAEKLKTLISTHSDFKNSIEKTKKVYDAEPKESKLKARYNYKSAQGANLNKFLQNLEGALGECGYGKGATPQKYIPNFVHLILMTFVYRKSDGRNEIQAYFEGLKKQVGTNNIFTETGKKIFDDINWIHDHYVNADEKIQTLKTVQSSASIKDFIDLKTMNFEDIVFGTLAQQDTLPPFSEYTDISYAGVTDIPDCAETTMMNISNSHIFDGQNFVIPNDALVLLQEFYKSKITVSTIESKATHEAWSEIVQNRPFLTYANVIKNNQKIRTPEDVHGFIKGLTLSHDIQQTDRTVAGVVFKQIELNNLKYLIIDETYTAYELFPTLKNLIILFNDLYTLKVFGDKDINEVFFDPTFNKTYFPVVCEKLQWEFNENSATELDKNDCTTEGLNLEIKLHNIKNEEKGDILVSLKNSHGYAQKIVKKSDNAFNSKISDTLSLPFEGIVNYDEPEKIFRYSLLNTLFFSDKILKNKPFPLLAADLLLKIFSADILNPNIVSKKIAQYIIKINNPQTFFILDRAIDTLPLTADLIYFENILESYKKHGPKNHPDYIKKLKKHLLSQKDTKRLYKAAELISRKLGFNEEICDAFITCALQGNVEAVKELIDLQAPGKKTQASLINKKIDGFLDSSDIGKKILSFTLLKYQNYINFEPQKNVNNIEKFNTFFKNNCENPEILKYWETILKITEQLALVKGGSALNEDSYIKFVTNLVHAGSYPISIGLFFHDYLSLETYKKLCSILAAKIPLSDTDIKDLFFMPGHLFSQKTEILSRLELLSSICTQTVLKRISKESLDELYNVFTNYKENKEMVALGFMVVKTILSDGTVKAQTYVLKKMLPIFEEKLISGHYNKFIPILQALDELAHRDTTLAPKIKEFLINHMYNIINTKNHAAFEALLNMQLKSIDFKTHTFGVDQGTLLQYVISQKFSAGEKILTSLPHDTKQDNIVIVEKLLKTLREKLMNLLRTVKTHA